MRGVLITWAAAWPTITTLLLILDGIVGDWPLLFRTLLRTALMVPLMTLLLVPALNRMIGHFEKTNRKRQIRQA